MRAPKEVLTSNIQTAVCCSSSVNRSKHWPTSLSSRRSSYSSRESRCWVASTEWYSRSIKRRPRRRRNRYIFSVHSRVVINWCEKRGCVLTMKVKLLRLIRQCKTIGLSQKKHVSARAEKEVYVMFLLYYHMQMPSLNFACILFCSWRWNWQINMQK